MRKWGKPSSEKKELFKSKHLKGHLGSYAHAVSVSHTLFTQTF